MGNLVVKSGSRSTALKVFGSAGRVMMTANVDGTRLNFNLAPADARALARELEMNADAAEHQQSLIDERRG